jgi:L-lactate dehydrogenase complex protein LldE
MRVALLATCLVDLLRPRVGWAEVDVPPQTCCGQPAYNMGDLATARALARGLIESFSGAPTVVVPSGSCAAMLRLHYPALLAEDPVWAPRARALAARTHELGELLGAAPAEARLAARATLHDSCSCRRELDLAETHRRLLAGVAGLDLRELPDAETCCGFGGSFCVKFPEISARLADDKLAAIAATAAEVVVAADLGCLTHLEARARRLGRSERFLHLAEVLAGMTGEAQ